VAEVRCAASNEDCTSGASAASETDAAASVSPLRYVSVRETNLWRMGGDSAWMWPEVRRKARLSGQVRTRHAEP
jgi:hypothetical protein